MLIAENKFSFAQPPQGYTINKRIDLTPVVGNFAFAVEHAPTKPLINGF